MKLSTLFRAYTFVVIDWRVLDFGPKWSRRDRQLIRLQTIIRRRIADIERKAVSQ